VGWLIAKGRSPEYRRGVARAGPAKPAGPNRKRTGGQSIAGGRKSDTILSNKRDETTARLSCTRFNAHGTEKSDEMLDRSRCNLLLGQLRDDSTPIEPTL